MKKTILSLLLFLLPAIASAQLQTCTVTATVYEWNGQPADSVEVRVVRVLNQAGKLLVARPYSYYTDTAGVASIIVPRSTATDTVTAYIFIDAWNSAFAAKGRLGVAVAIPNAATANLEDLTPTETIPLTHVIAVPSLVFNDSTGARNLTMDTIRIGSGLLLVPIGGGSSGYTLINTVSSSSGVPSDSLDANTVRPAPFRAELSDSLDTVVRSAISLGVLSDSLDTVVRTEVDPTVSDSLDTVVRAEVDPFITDSLDANAVRAEVDPFINDSLDANVVRAEVDPFINDSLDANAVRAEVDPFINDSLDANAVRAEIDPFINDSLDANAVRAEVDPFINDSLDVFATIGTRSTYSEKRIYTGSDSITFAGEAGDVIDLSLGNSFRGTISANDTLSFANIPAAGTSQVVQVLITNAGTHTLAWSGVAWPAGTAPTLTAVANKRSIFSFLISGGMIHGVSVLNY